MIIYGKNDPQNNLECKFVHQNQNLCAIDPLTPHNATPVEYLIILKGMKFKGSGKLGLIE